MVSPYDPKHFRSPLANGFDKLSTSSWVGELCRSNRFGSTLFKPDFESPELTSDWCSPGITLWPSTPCNWGFSHNTPSNWVCSNAPGVET